LDILHRQMWTTLLARFFFFTSIRSPKNKERERKINCF
jgi:hypothetical protein